MDDVEMSSVCSIGPNKELLEAVESKNLGLFKTILKNASVDLSYEYTKPYPGTILDICCVLPYKHLFIRELLSAGVNVNYLNKSQNKAPIHLAAMNRCKYAFYRLLLYQPKTDVNLPDGDGNTVLHILAMAGDMDCSEFLLRYRSEDIKPNRLNKKGLTPAYIVATLQKNNEKLMILYLRCVQ